MAVCESTIDALSLAAIEGTVGKQFFSVAGKCRPRQIEYLCEFAKRKPALQEIWLAFDNDQAGNAMARELRQQLRRQLSDSIAIVEKFPEAKNADWNDELNQQDERASLPTRKME